MTKQDEEFVYRARRYSEPVDPAVKRIVLGAGGISVLVIAVALFWGGVRGAGFGPPPVILPPSTPLRVAPADPGGLTVPEANVPIMSGDDVAAPASLSPAPAAPDITQLDQSAGLTPPTPSAPPAPMPTAPSGSAAPVSPAPVVQLAAMSDEPSALAFWNKLQAKLPDALAGKSPAILPAVVNGQSVWLLQLGGFATPAAAQAFCATLTAKGAACMVPGP